MRTTLRWLAIGSILLAMIAEGAARTRPHYGGTLRLEMDAPSWQDDDSLFLLVAETLTHVDSYGEAQPLLATRWESQNGARRWLFTIRQGVEWHDGTALTPEAVADSLRKEASGSELEGCRTSASGTNSVVIECDAPMPNLPALLALSRFPIVRFDQATPLGTGPFRVTRSSENRTTLEAFDPYWHGRPYLDSMEITAGRAVRDEWMDSAIHRADIVTVPAEMLRRAQQEQLRPISSGNIELVALQASLVGGTIDVRLRQALAATVDRAALLNFIFQKQGEVAAGLLPNWLSGLNCAAVPAELIESELFGHEKGSFTGAANRHTGKFEQAHRGTLFLDEIGDMPLSMQAKLLRVLEEGEVERVGGDHPIAVNVRVIVATHRNLEEQVREGQFRQDLFHRIYVFPLLLPPLRERMDDIPLLVDHFARQVCAQNGWKPAVISGEAIRMLQQYRWPGNVRELRNVVERLLLLACDGAVDADCVRLALPDVGTTHLLAGPTAGDHEYAGALSVQVAQFEHDVIVAELERQSHHITNTAKALGLERSHLYKKCQALGIRLCKDRQGQ
jgi:hypothetical protein